MNGIHSIHSTIMSIIIELKSASSNCSRGRGRGVHGWNWPASEGGNLIHTESEDILNSRVPLNRPCSFAKPL